jgi:hypothetical protein
MSIISFTAPPHAPRCMYIFFFHEAFCDISPRLGGITPFGVFSDFQGLKIWDTFACANANFLTHFIISIAVLENVPPDAGLQKRDTCTSFAPIRRVTGKARNHIKGLSTRAILRPNCGTIPRTISRTKRNAI